MQDQSPEENVDHGEQLQNPRLIGLQVDSNLFIYFVSERIGERIEG